MRQCLTSVAARESAKDRIIYVWHTGDFHADKVGGVTN
jgi:hypothetical protein